MKIALTIAFIIVAVVLAILVLSQEGKENGFTGSFTGSVDTYWGKNKGRSLEGKLVLGTRVLCAAFIILAILLNLSRI